MDKPTEGIPVVIVIPAHTDGRRGEPAEYLGAGYLAGTLDARGIPCEIIHADLFGLKAEQIVQILDFTKPRVIGFSVMQPAIRQVARVIHLLKNAGHTGDEATHRPTIVLGGHYPTIAPEPLLEELQEVEYILRGDAEDTFTQLVDCVREGHPLTDVPGLVFRGPDGHPRQVPGGRRPRLDALPFPDRRFLEAVIAAGGECNVCSSRGCHWDCHFCQHSHVLRGLPRPTLVRPIARGGHPRASAAPGGIPGRRDPIQ